jgi:thioredoxin 1
MSVASISQNEFETKVLKSPVPVLLDFWAPWCAPCKMAEPVLEALSDTYKDKTTILKVNVDENNDLAISYSVMSIPTTIMFKGGKEIGRQIGFAGQDAFENLIKQAI